MLSFCLCFLAGISFVFTMTALGSATVLLLPAGRGHGLQNVMLGFSGGVMTAASVWSLLIPAMEQSAVHGTYPAWLPASAGLLAGAVFLSLLDLWRYLKEDRTLLFAAVTLHNIPEGMAVGLAFALAENGDGMAAALALAFGIGVQNFPEGAAVSMPLYQSGVSRGRAFIKGVASGAVEPFFAVLALVLTPVLFSVMPWLLGFSAGAMLYVTVHELLRRAEGSYASFGFIGGFMLMMILDVALG